MSTVSLVGYVETGVNVFIYIGQKLQQKW